MSESPSARIRALVKTQQWRAAVDAIAALVEDSFGFRPQETRINADQYSLNSVNGFLTAPDGREFFFKFHQEEEEGTHTGEYYRAELLHEAGYPIDTPAYVSREIGKQMVLYRRRHDPRLADLCLAVERGESNLALEIIAAQRTLDALIADRYLATLHPITAQQSGQEPIHQLFHHRLVDRGDDARLGGRAARFYEGARFDLAGVTLGWREFSEARWCINGTCYRQSFGELLQRARQHLHPRGLAGSGGVTAHGDAHNANVWCEQREGELHLRFFDPAFAGRHVPTLLAEIKATFHNIFAHPFWLYDPKLLEPLLHIEARYECGWLHVEHDWQLSDLRRAFFTSKRDLIWRPLLRELNVRGWLPADWPQIVRLALFCCPTLVMCLRAGTGDRSPATATLAFTAAMSVGSEIESGPGDALSHFVPQLADADFRS
jgi:hypothetical protein